ncbi:MAG: 4-hydroxybenzoyl-CoA thioesterase [Phycisphaerae bacterium]|nr:MAG: 4-hydroxybenzoyl-CoA thioesterase [Phycisphaerae bacterium]
MAYTHKRTVQFAETDMAGVMHFSNYFRIMEEAEHAFWRSMGHGVHVTDGDKTISWPRVAVKCSYVAPVQFEEELTIKISVTKIGKRSLTMRYDFKSNDRNVAHGEMKTVCCEVSEGKFGSIDIPPHVRGLLEAHPADA